DAIRGHLLDGALRVALLNVYPAAGINQQRDLQPQAARIEGAGADTVISGQPADVEVRHPVPLQAVGEGLAVVRRAVEGGVGVLLRIGPLGDEDGRWGKLEVGVELSAARALDAVRGPGAAKLLEV